MLPKNIWRSWEPRFGFPVFKGTRTLVSFSIRSDFAPLQYKKLVRDGIRALRGGGAPALAFIRDTAPFLFFCRGNQIRFRIAVTTRNGEFLGVYRIPGVYPPGGSVDVDMTEVVSCLGLPDDEYMAIMIMTKGRHDGMRSSPGSYSMTYAGEKSYSTYRTGGFTRVLNDPRKKSHFGFRGINPASLATAHALSSIFLINHSSDLLYDAAVSPVAILLRPDGRTREAKFGCIPAFGGLERSLEDLFGSDVGEFLAPFGGQGTTITTCPGVTLASIHIIRSRNGSSFSIEHSRPTHTYLLHGISGTAYREV